MKEYLLKYKFNISIIYTLSIKWGIIMKQMLTYLLMTAIVFGFVAFFISFGVGWFYYTSLNEMVLKTAPFLIFSIIGLALL